MAGECRFVLSDIKENEIRDELGFHVFEPTVSLELESKNAFEVLGINGARPVVIMAFLEDALEETNKLVTQADRRYPFGEFHYWLHGTGCEISLRVLGEKVEVFLEADWGPGAEKGKQLAGSTTLTEWVQAIVALAKDLLERFRLFNPQVYSYLADLSVGVQGIESWLIAKRS